VLLSGMATPPSPSHRGGACVTSQIDPGYGYSKIEPSLENKDHINKLNYSKSITESTCNITAASFTFYVAFEDSSKSIALRFQPKMATNMHS
jgi:hypothetical protein